MHRATVDAEIHRRGPARTSQAARQFEEVLLDHEHELPHPEPRIAVDVAFRMVFGTLARRVTRGKGFEMQDEISDDRLVRELEHVVVAHLLTAPGD